jgi:hypothetical protein
VRAHRIDDGLRLCEGLGRKPCGRARQRGAALRWIQGLPVENLHGDIP